MTDKHDILISPLNIEDNKENDSEEKTVNKSWWKNIPCVGYVFISLKVIFHTGTNLMVKKMTKVHPLSLLLYRSLMILTISLPWSVSINRSPFPPDQTTEDRLCLLFRGMVGCLNMWANFYSLRHLSFGNQKIIVATRPIFVSLSAKIFLKEPCGLLEILNIILMSAGIIFVLKPTFLFPQVASEVSPSDPVGMTSAMCLLITTILASNITVIIRKLRKDHVATLTATNQLIIIIESFFIIFLFGYELVTPELWEDRLLVVLVSAGNIGYVILEMMALKVEEANKVSLLDNSLGIILAFIAQVVIFEDIPSLSTVGGTSLVFLAVVITGIKKMFCK